MKIIDAHLHLDDSHSKDLTQVIGKLCSELDALSIERAVLLHLNTQRWSVDEIAEKIKGQSKLVGFIHIDPTSRDAKHQLIKGVEELDFVGMKLHPRIDRFSPDDQRVISITNLAGEMNIPTLIDAFPDGQALMQGFNPCSFAVLGDSCKKSKIIWAHMGGHHVLDFMMLAKRLPNIFLDLSFSLLYYQGSSVYQDILYAMRNMKYDRIFYGSDYPDRSLQVSLENTVSCLQSAEIQKDDFDKIMFKNAKDFFCWTDI